MKLFEHVKLEAFEPKRVNPVLNIIEVNSLGLGGLQLTSCSIKQNRD